MGLSSNIIWHQTNYKGLKDIIHDKCFKCSYSLETIKWGNHVLERAFPMISFFDIPLADMRDFLRDNQNPIKLIGKYGKYTLGLRRSWGKTAKLSPVWYRDSQATSLQIQVNTFNNMDIKLTKEVSKYYEYIWNTMAYTKNYEGKLKKYGFELYRFYDEREMRFVPDVNLLRKKKIKEMMNGDEYDEYKKQNKSALIKDEDLSLPFTIEDIVYILYSSPQHLNDVKQVFEKDNIEKDNIEKDNIEKIAFLSYKQVEQDIIGLSHNRKV